MSRVRIPLPAPESQGFSESGADEKALALPKPGGEVVALPAAPAVRLLDLLRAIDGAALAGDVFAVRALTAAAIRQLDGQADEAERSGGAL